MKRAIYRVVVPVLIMFLLLQSFSVISYAASSGKLNKLTVVSSETLGDPIQNVQITANTVQKDSSGNHIFYGLTNGTLFAYNLDTDAVLYTATIGEATTLDLGPDGILYVASNSDAKLYRFNTATKALDTISGLSFAPETSVMGKGAFDSSGNYYFGTYPNAALYQYNVTQKKLVKIQSNVVDGEYIRATASCGDYVFMGGLGYTENGINVPAELKVYDASTGKISTVAPPIWEEMGVVEGEVSKYYSMSSSGKYLFARFACYTAKTSWVMGVYDSEQKKWVDFRLGTSHLHASDMDDDGYIYMRAVGTKGTRTFVGYNPATKDLIDYDAFSFYTDQLISPYVVELKNQTKYPGKTVVFGASGKGIAKFNLQTGNYEFIVDALPAISKMTRTIKGGPNNEIMVSSEAGTQMALFDGTTKKVKQKFDISQKESINYFDGKYYVGSYGEQGAIQTIDLDSGSLTKVADMSGHHQGRAFVLEDAEDYIIWGTISDYGYLGGAVGIYNKSDKTTRVYSKYSGYATGKHPSFFENQSISGLTYLNGYVYGSTTMFAGLGVTPVTAVSTVFKMDVTNGAIVQQKTLTLSTDSNPQYFAGGMTVSDDGRIFMACPQTLVELDPSTLAIKKEMRLGSLVKDASGHRWQPFALEWGVNGLLYTNIGNDISAVDIDTWESKTLSSSGTAMLTLGTDGNVYYLSSDKCSLKRINLQGEDWTQEHGKAEIKGITVNGTPLSGVSANQMIYYVDSPAGTTSAEVKATTSTGATTVITQSETALPFNVQIKVTSKDGTATNTYTIYFRQATVTGFSFAGATDGTDKYTMTVANTVANPTYRAYIYSGQRPTTPTISSCTSQPVDITKYLPDLNKEYTVEVETLKNEKWVLCGVKGTLNTHFNSGSGTTSDPYLIYNLRQLKNVSKYPSAAFEQQADITSALTTSLAEFTGSYNGNGKSVKLSISSTGDSVGMFSSLKNASVSNVVTKGTVSGKNNVGGVVGLATDSAIQNCENQATIKGTGQYTGGIAGRLTSATVTHCVNRGAVTGTWYVGGITGGQTLGSGKAAATALVQQSANYGNVEGTNVVGGIVGFSYANVQECFNSGDITATTQGSGGVVGHSRGTTIASCYNTGTITGPNAAGVARLSDHANSKLTMTNCYNVGKIINDLNTEDMAAKTTGSNSSSQTLAMTNCYYASETLYDDNVDGTKAYHPAVLENIKLTTKHYTTDKSLSRYPVLINILPTEKFIFNSITIKSTGKGTVNQTGIHYVRGNETLALTITPAENHMIASVNMNGVDIFTNTLETLLYTVPVLDGDAVINITFAPYSAGNQVVTTPNVFQQATDPRFVVFATVSEGNWTLQKYGVVISATQQTPQLGLTDCTECIAYGKKNTKGQFGIAFSGIGLLDQDAYYVRAYAVYLDSDNQPQTFYGEPIKIVME